MAILREAGKIDLDRGDRPSAEKRWAKMLEVILPPPAPKTKKAAEKRKGAEKPKARIAPASFRVRAQVMTKAAPSRRRHFRKRPGSSVATVDRFEQAAGLAKLAAENGMVNLSLRSIREALKGGPPMRPLNTNQRMGMRYSGSVMNTGDDQQNDSINTSVESKLAELDATWTRTNADPVAVYETLRAIVLPEGRSSEAFLYARPIVAAPVRRPRSVAGLIARWAVKADRVADFDTLIVARQSEVLAEMNALTLRVIVDLAAKDVKKAATDLEALKKRLAKDQLVANAETACLAALPALDFEPLFQPALDILNIAAKAIEANPNSPLLSRLRLTLARLLFERKEVAKGREELKRYLEAMDRGLAVQGEQAAQQRKMYLVQVAAEYARAGLVNDALDSLGSEADLPTQRYGEQDISPILTMIEGLLSSRPALNRYELLKRWTFPAPKEEAKPKGAEIVDINIKSPEKSIAKSSPSVKIPSSPAASDKPKGSAVKTARLLELLANFARREPIPLVFHGETVPAGVKNAPPERAGEVVCTADWLILGAKEAGKLDDLIAVLEPLATEKLENAQEMLVLARIAQGNPDMVKSRVEAALASARKKVPPPPNPNNQPNPYVRIESKPIAWPEFLVAVAAIREPALCTIGEDLVDALALFEQRTTGQFRDALLKLQAEAVLTRARPR